MVNTVGFTGCPKHLEIWRQNAARQEADDRYTVLFNACVEALTVTADIGSAGRAGGLIEAYALVTGDSYETAWTQVNKARLDRQREAVAHPGTVTVTS